MNEGGPLTQILSQIKKHGKNTDTLIEFATVTSAAPVRILIDNMRIELEADDLVIAERLTDYTYDAQINGGETVEIAVNGALKVGDRVIVAQINDGQIYVILDRKREAI